MKREATDVVSLAEEKGTSKTEVKMYNLHTLCRL